LLTTPRSRINFLDAGEHSPQSTVWLAWPTALIIGAIMGLPRHKRLLYIFIERLVDYVTVKISRSLYTEFEAQAHKVSLPCTTQLFPMEPTMDAGVMMDTWPNVLVNAAGVKRCC